MIQYYYYKGGAQERVAICNYSVFSIQSFKGRVFFPLRSLVLFIQYYDSLYQLSSISTSNLFLVLSELIELLS
jgi:hypothetical protein